MAKKRYTIYLDLESEDDGPLPDDDTVIAALSHSTAGEAIATALEENPCLVSMYVAEHDLVAAAKWVLEDATDRGETHGDDGKEFDDWAALRMAVNEALPNADPERIENEK